MAKPRSPRRTKAQWIKLIENKRHSALSINEYCKQNQITVSRFYAWNSKLNKQLHGEPSDASGSENDNWLPISLSSPSPTQLTWDIELTLPGGMTLSMKGA